MDFRTTSARPTLEGMKTYRYRSRLALDDLHLDEDRPPGELGPTDVLVRVDAVALEYRDLAIANGTYGDLAAPLVPGSNAAGTVLATGARVRRVRVGDLVCPTYVPDWIDGPPRPERVAARLGGPRDGVLRERLVVGEEALVRAPAGWSAVQASTLPVAASAAYQALVEVASVRLGDDVVVHGTGASSLYLAQIALAAGASVVVVGRDAGRLERFRALGARVVAADGAWDARVRDLTGGRGAHVVVDTVGGDALDRAAAAARLGGTVVLYGFTAGTRGSLDLVAAIRRSVALRAVSGGSRESLERVVRAVDAAGDRGPIRAVVDRVFSFEDVRAAFAHLASGRPFGKVVVRVAEVA